MKYRDLPFSKKLKVIEWLEEGLLGPMRGKLTASVYAACISDMQGKKTFDFEQIWDAVPERQQNHWDHVRPYLDLLDEERKRILQKMKPTPQTPEPKLTNGGCDGR